MWFHTHKTCVHARFPVILMKRDSYREVSLELKSTCFTLELLSYSLYKLCGGPKWKWFQFTTVLSMPSIFSSSVQSKESPTVIVMIIVKWVVRTFLRWVFSFIWYLVLYVHISMDICGSAWQQPTIRTLLCCLSVRLLILSHSLLCSPPLKRRLKWRLTYGY